RFLRSIGLARGIARGRSAELMLAEAAVRLATPLAAVPLTVMADRPMARMKPRSVTSTWLTVGMSGDSGYWVWRVRCRSLTCTGLVRGSLMGSSAVSIWRAAMVAFRF